MIKHILSIILIASALMSKAQPSSSPQPCSELFFTELTFGKVPNASGQFDLNYSVEIFNPTGLDVNLVDYTIQLVNASGGTIIIPITGTVFSKDVFVVSNDNADLNLQGLSDFLSSSLDFENYASMTLNHNGNIVDRIGQIGTPTSGAIDFTQLLTDPANYLANFHIDLNDFENIDMRRSMLVNSGNPVCANATDITNQWYFTFNTDRSDIGQYLGLCNKPLATTISGFQLNFYSMYRPGPATPTVDYLHLVYSGYNPWTYSFNIFQTTGGSGTIGNTSNDDLKWANCTTCGSSANNLTVINNSGQPSDWLISQSNTNSHKFINIKLTSNHTDLIIDPLYNHQVIDLKSAPLGLNDSKIKELKMYPTICSDFFTIESDELLKFNISTLEGKQVRTGLSNLNYTQIDTYNLPKGNYIITFISSRNVKSIKRFTKI